MDAPIRSAMVTASPELGQVRRSRAGGSVIDREAPLLAVWGVPRSRRLRKRGVRVCRCLTCWVESVTDGLVRWRWAACRQAGPRNVARPGRPAADRKTCAGFRVAADDAQASARQASLPRIKALLKRRADAATTKP